MSDYTSYRVEMQPRAPFLTEWVADVLWGHMLWAAIERDQDIDDWVDTEGQPPMVLSDPFPKGCLPAPVVPTPSRGIRELAEKYADGCPTKLATNMGLAKKLMGLRWLPAKVVRQVLAAENPQAGMLTLIEGVLAGQLAFADLDHSRRAQTHPSRHTAIDRLTGTALEGRLFDLTDVYLACKWECWVRTTLPKSELDELLTHVGEHGYGKRASVGKGHFDVTRVEPGRPLAGLEAQRGWFMALSSCYVPNGETCLAEAHYKLKIKRGRKHLSTQFCKQPVAKLAAGSVFQGDPGEHPGRLLKGVYEPDEHVVEYGFTYPLEF